MSDRLTRIATSGPRGTVRDRYLVHGTIAPRFVAAHEAGGSHSAVRPEYVYNDSMARILFRRRNQSPLAHALWRLAYGVYLTFVFPWRARAAKPR